MAWKELRFALGKLDAECVETALEGVGAAAVTLEDAADDALLEPAPGEHPLWPSSRVRALFDARCNLDEVIAALRARLNFAESAGFEITAVEDRQWETAWRQDFNPMRFGRRLWVCPTGETAPADAIVIHLDPGLAFGTGTHPTTALCLDWLDHTPLDGATVIDYGCGSGILAIAAAKLGAARVIAVDHDPQALTATRGNAAANDVMAVIETVAPAALNASIADVVVANILARPLIELAKHFAALLGDDGRLALSGLLAPQCAQVAAAYARWFAMNDAILRDDWALLEGRRHPVTD
ncbi:MAG TPA: 50S ribosomal protein L11 methyltransferase [Gammaproteobacteria bacterium]|nr:50S ribosomal protein L11 methyltransferase [Gammaproteobacteria bacterium]